MRRASRFPAGSSARPPGTAPAAVGLDPAAARRRRRDPRRRAARCSRSLWPASARPRLPGQPLQARLEASPDDASLEQLVVQVETHLAQNPEDGRGWEVLAPIYLKAGRYAQARQAYANAVRLLGSTGEREASVGEAATAAADGVVTADAHAAFQRAVAKDPANARARYFLGRAKEQDGDKAGAARRLGRAPRAAAERARPSRRSCGARSPASAERRPALRPSAARPRPTSRRRRR